MGRAIVRDPQVFLFDEPLSNLDAKLRVQMRTEIKELHQRLKTTTIYVTHDQIEAMTMADKIVVMHDGLVEQIGAPLELYDKPDNLFVAGFIGSPAMNFLKGIVRANGRLEFEGPGGTRLPLAAAPAGSDGRAAVYGVRPEHFVTRRRWRRSRGPGDRADRLGDSRSSPSSAARTSSPYSANATNSSRATRSGSSPIRGSCICSTRRRATSMQLKPQTEERP